MIKLKFAHQCGLQAWSSSLSEENYDHKPNPISIPIFWPTQNAHQFET